MFEWLDQVVYGKVTWFDLVIAVIILIGSFVVAKVLATQLRRNFKEKISKENLELTVKIFSYGIMIVAILWVMPMIGLEPAGLMVAGGIVALAIGFASQSIISNLISGLFLMGERPVKIGDLVEISGNLGFVEDIHIISTSIRTLDGNYIRIPNETVFTTSIINYTSTPVRRFEYSVGISYADDAELAIQIIKNLINDHPLALVSPGPQVYVEALGDNSVDIVVRVWSPSTEWFPVKMDLLWMIKKALDEAGIEIPFPQRVVWFGGNNGEAAVE
jgi:small-conductance mechanosensitive channel